MANQITHEKAKSKLKRKINQMYTKQEQEKLEFFPDREDKTTYSWIFKDGSRKIELICCLKQGIIITTSSPC